MSALSLDAIDGQEAQQCAIEAQFRGIAKHVDDGACLYEISIDTRVVREEIGHQDRCRIAQHRGNEIADTRDCRATSSAGDRLTFLFEGGVLCLLYVPWSWRLRHIRPCRGLLAWKRCEWKCGCDTRIRHRIGIQQAHDRQFHRLLSCDIL